MNMGGRFLQRRASKAICAGLPFGQFREGLYRYLLRKLRDPGNAEDLTQEIYLRLLRVADRKLVRDPQAYVFGVTFNVLHEFRLDARQNPVEFNSEAVMQLGEALADDAHSPADAEHQRAMRRWLDGVLMQLSPMQRAVLLMAKRQGLAHAQIAENLGISIGTVRKHLARAMIQCRKNAEITGVKR